MRTILFILFFIFTSILFGQKRYTLTLSNSNYSVFKKKIPKYFSDSLEAKKYISDLDAEISKLKQ